MQMMRNEDAKSKIEEADYYDQCDDAGYAKNVGAMTVIKRKTIGFELNPSESIAGHVRSAGGQRARIRKLIIFQRFLRFLEI